MLTNQCPYCQSLMEVTRMACPGCQCAIEGPFATTRLGRLPSEHQRFIEIFLLAGGNLKEIAQHAGVSYPTVRSRLDKVIDALIESKQALAEQVVGAGETWLIELSSDELRDLLTLRSEAVLDE